MAKNKLAMILPIFLAVIILLSGVSGCSGTPADTTVSQTPAATSSPAATATTAPASPSPTAVPTTAAPAPTTRVITDMYGTELTVPAVINRVIATGPVETQLLYILAPEKLAGMNMVWNGDYPFIPQEYKEIPNIGNASSGSFSYEAAIAVNPDIVLEGKTKNLDTDREKFGTIPVVGVNAGGDLLTMYEDEIKYVADLLGVPERGEALLAYYHEAMEYTETVTATLTEVEKIRVYYAEGNDGLQTDAQGSWHTNLLTYCGGINVAAVEVSNTSQAVQVSLEQVYAWNTEETIDMIIIGRSSQTTTYHAILNSADWKVLECVKQGNVHIRPDNPTSWFDGPPGYGQILGMYWMVHTLYPEKTADLDLKAKIKEFYAKFLHYNLTNTDVALLLANPA